MLMGFLKPDEGSIRVEGQEIVASRRGLRAIRKRITWFSRTARSSTPQRAREVAFPLRERGGSARNKSREG